MKKVLKIFGMVFLKAFIVLACMILCGVGGFFGTRTYYVGKIKKMKSKEATKMIGSAQIDKISKNLIYEYDDDSRKIIGCLLEVFNTKDNKMEYITIPTNGEITITPNIYQKLYHVNKEIPQVFKLSNLCKYFDEDDTSAFGYGVIILESYFNMDISYYTVVPKATFENMFEEKKAYVKNDGTIEGIEKTTDESDNTTTKTKSKKKDSKTEADPYEHDDRFATVKSNKKKTTTENSSTTTQSYAGSTTQAVVKKLKKYKVKVYVVKDEFLDQVGKYTTKSKLYNYVQSASGKVQSNLSSKDKASYTDAYLKLTPEDYSYSCVPGTSEKKIYDYNLSYTAKLLRGCGVIAKESASDDDNSDESSNTEKKSIKNIVILNSTRISGVASSWSTTLTQEGYNVNSVGNYGTYLPDTKIIVKESGTGDSLKQYFKNATVEVGNVPNGAEAEVIIGKNDVKQ